MRIICDEGGLRIEPEDAQDRAYLRDVIGVADNGDTAAAVWLSRVGTDALIIEKAAREGGE